VLATLVILKGSSKRNSTHHRLKPLHHQQHQDLFRFSVAAAVAGGLGYGAGGLPRR
jgi:hypothetical protein